MKVIRVSRKNLMTVAIGLDLLFNITSKYPDKLANLVGF